MKTQREFVQVSENLQRDLAYSALRDACKENLAQLREQRGRKTQCAVEQQQHGGQGECLLRAAQAVDHLLENQRHADIGQFCTEQTREGHKGSPFVLPQIGQQLVEGQPEMTVGGRGSFGCRVGGGGSAHGFGVSIGFLILRVCPVVE